MSTAREDLEGAALLRGLLQEHHGKPHDGTGRIYVTDKNSYVVVGHFIQLVVDQGPRGWRVVRQQTNPPNTGPSIEIAGVDRWEFPLDALVAAKKWLVVAEAAMRLGSSV